MTGAIQVATAAGLFRVTGERRVEFEGRAVSDVVRSGLDRWALVDGREMWRHAGDDGWSRVATISEHRGNRLLPVDDHVFVGTSHAHLMRIGGPAAEPVEAFERAPGRDRWYTPWGGPPDVRSLAGASAGRLYVNVHVGGILRSDDDGDTWTSTIDIDSDVHEVIAPSDDLVMAATGVGLATSSDGGDTWTFDDANLHASYARAVALSGRTVFLTASLGPRGGRAAIYRRALDDPGSFAKCDAGLPEWFEDNIDTACVAGSDDTVAFGAGDGRVFASGDGGESWQEVASGLPSITRVVIG